MESEHLLPKEMEGYNDYIERMRDHEYLMLKDAVYLDHAGTTLYSKSLMENFHGEMMATLYGNPHSASNSSQASTLMIDDVRLQVLRFFGADPLYFDLVFTANATAGIKLISDAFRDLKDGFSYGYHVDSHTSMIGVRESADEHTCLEMEGDVETWIAESTGTTARVKLFGYPAQSNMNGRRLPLSWCMQATQSHSSSSIYTLLDSAAYASTSPLDFSNVDTAPDFSVVSLYKIFGFPDLGALIVKKVSASVLQSRRYFGGGTVDMVACLKEQWHVLKTGSLHKQLEDGTIPTHSILALRSALKTHKKLFGSMEMISKHTAGLALQLYQGLSLLRHWNDVPACTVHKHSSSDHRDTSTQGPIVAFNLRNSQGDWVSNTEVEKLASIKNINLRTGGVCNPGGVATALELSPWELRENFSEGHRCGSENDIVNDKPTGIIRCSIGAMSTRSDIERFLAFIEEFFVDKAPAQQGRLLSTCDSRRFYIESLAIYPIKSCGGFDIPPGRSWEVRPEGLVWDREWCVVHQGTSKALSQKQYPHMALIRPTLDFIAGLLRISLIGGNEEIHVPLSKDPRPFLSGTFDSGANVCEDMVQTLQNSSAAISDFFTKAIGVPCTLARLNNTSPCRQSKLRFSRYSDTTAADRPLQLSNESPILTISRSSLNRLNEQVKAKGGRAAQPSLFRANIILAENPLMAPGFEQPWAEDLWAGMRVGGESGPVFDFLGGCKRCQMICVDQSTAEKSGEPFLTLAKTRRSKGMVLFGVHTALSSHAGTHWTVKAGATVETFTALDQT